jgi:mRNA deadenylase 3'-5' endonuclease subunit Ccr4
MSDWRKVDGCAIFYKNDIFTLLDVTLVEYQAIALQKHDTLTYNKKDNGFNRLITKDNIALCLLLQPTRSTTPNSSSTTPLINSTYNKVITHTHTH